MDFARRKLLQGAAAVATVACCPAIFAAEWPKAAFDSRTLDSVLRNLGAAGPADSKDIQLEMPEIAEDGDSVPVTVSSRIPNTQAIALIVKRNYQPLAAYFQFEREVEPRFRLNLRIEKTSQVAVLIKAGGKYYSYSRETKVAVKGCHS